MIPYLNELTHVASGQGVIYQVAVYDLKIRKMHRNDCSRRHFLLAMFPEVGSIGINIRNGMVSTYLYNYNCKQTPYGSQKTCMQQNKV